MKKNRAEAAYRHYETGDERLPLGADCTAVLDAVERSLGGSSDLILSRHSVNGVKIGVIMFDGLVSNRQAADFLLRPLAEVPPGVDSGQKLFDYLQDTVYLSSEQGAVETYEELYIKTMSGFAAVVIDGVPKALTYGYQGFTIRGVDEPSAETNLRGSREGFCESLTPNIALVRRRLKSPYFVAESVILGAVSRTQARILYVSGAADKRLVEAVRRRLAKIEIDVLLDTGYIQPFLEGERASVFSSVGVTERPDTLCAKLLEGKVAVMVDGSPFVILTPYLLVEHFHSLDDYTQRPYFAVFVRLLKLAAFFITILLPGVYVAVLSFHPELIPGLLLGSLISSVVYTPLPVLGEALLLFAVYELLREAGLRLPRPIGHSLGIVSGIVIGDAAVDAGLVGMPMLIIIALTAIASFVVPTLYEPVTVLRFAFILAGGLLGLFGVYLLLAVLVTDICSLSGMGVPYTAPYTPTVLRSMRDMIYRAGWKQLQRASFTVEGLSDDE